jgi:predicted nuclease with RNAse H fold
VRTLGIDLASQEKRTAMAAIVWDGAGAYVERPVTSVSDGAALDAMSAADRVGIDAPFGWPEPFLRALTGFAERGEWVDAANVDLAYRLTDRYVHGRTGRWPLSVSSDRIAVPAWRCARLLASFARGPVDRLGGNGVVEVYPGAALTVWAFERRGYKREGPARELLVEEIERRGEGWLDLSAAREACVVSDDALDAVICALVARAAALDMTWPPPAESVDVVRREGWIHVPKPETFPELARA